eukprot:gene32394-39989_t
MNATFPFSGGTYGIARVTLGKFPAFLIGIYGALYGSVVFVISVISLIGFQDDQGAAVIIAIVLLVVLTARYYFRGRHKEVYNSEEQAVLFIAYVVKANTASKRRIT